MAATFCEITGGDRNRDKVVHRLGSLFSQAVVKTWNTEIFVKLFRDGEGRVEIRRGEEVLLDFDLPPEPEAEPRSKWLKRHKREE